MSRHWPAPSHWSPCCGMPVDQISPGIYTCDRCEQPVKASDLVSDVTKVAAIRIQHHATAPPPAGRCRHCGTVIELLGNGHWVDLAGFHGCIKGGLPGSGRPPVLHEPMPAGLNGAPS